jgi:hypothetical protein
MARRYLQGLQRALNSVELVAFGSVVTAALGLFFVFVWAPHPWGHEGFDHYHQLALALAAGQPFPTLEVPWGYAYFAAFFYRLFGDRPAILLVAQVLLNASVPWLVYRFAMTWTDRATAVVAAAIAGVFSFNTIYASTQSSDAVCTVIVMTALVVFSAARRNDRWRDYASVGLLMGLAPQFRPNLILLPLLLAAYALLEVRSRLRLTQVGLLLMCAAAALTPWVARNYRLTRSVLPTSVHGGVQLWYGTLQVGPYLSSRAYNPRTVFDAAVFDYTSLATVPILITAEAKACADAAPSDVALMYWTDRDTAHRQISPVRMEGGAVRFELPAPETTEVIYYYFDATWSLGGSPTRLPTPSNGMAAPFVYFVSENHLGDLDVHGDLLDIFDLVRIARHAAWGEPLAFEQRLAAAGIGADDVERAAGVLGRSAVGNAAEGRLVAAFDHDDGNARLTFRDGSTIAFPRVWSGRITDLTLGGPLALAIMRSTVSLAALAHAASAPGPTHAIACAQFEDVGVNRVFNRQEPHQMRRYSALAFDNIRRDPPGFLRACLYRALRVFVVAGTDDRHTAQQFSRSAIIYAVATLTTTLYFALFVAGVVVAWRRGDRMLLPLALVAYVPITIAPVLTNMRYSVTVQPIVFIFIAAALTAWLERAGWLEGSRAARGRGDTRTTPPL